MCDWLCEHQEGKAVFKPHLTMSDGKQVEAWAGWRGKRHRVMVGTSGFGVVIGCSGQSEMMKEEAWKCKILTGWQVLSNALGAGVSLCVYLNKRAMALGQHIHGSLEPFRCCMKTYMYMWRLLELTQEFVDQVNLFSSWNFQCWIITLHDIVPLGVWTVYWYNCFI